MPSIKFDEAKQQMSQIRDSLAREAGGIRTNANFSNRGRAREIAKAVLVHRKRAQMLRDQFHSDNDARRVQLTAKLFGIPANADPATVLVARDADDRASQLGRSADAKVMLTRALERGDTLLARAVAGHAFGNGWGDVTETYAEATGLSETLDELTDLPSGPMTSLAEAALFAVPAPPELRTFVTGQSDDELRRFAEDDGTHAQRASAHSVGVGAPLDLSGSR
jgi:hypothetical protein